MRLWTKWVPWRYLVRRIATAHGFLDPIPLLAKMAKFAQPSEVGAPIELLRAGVVFHARGLVNTKAIQNNLDWVWPFWVVRQFDPRDESFLPRSFSITHVNLTHRNWTAVGLPGCEALPLVGPRGLVTPFYDGWSLDAWILADDGAELLPSRAADAAQTLRLGEDDFAVRTEVRAETLRLAAVAHAAEIDGAPQFVGEYTARAEVPAWLVLSLRPCNPEGISFIDHVRLLGRAAGWEVNGKGEVRLDPPMEKGDLSNYDHGDVYSHLRGDEPRCDEPEITCDAGMVTAAALYRLEPGKERRVTARVDLTRDPEVSRHGRRVVITNSWSEEMRGTARLSVPDARIRFLYDAALRTLVLHSPGEVWPGPYTYKRFWFRDAAFILQAMLCTNMIERSERVLREFPERQTRDGYFLSQEGEWDANGEALWILRRFRELSGRPLDDWWRDVIRRGAEWIERKRLPDDGSLHAGLLPAGFSAEHLGNNDYYLWDDFWAIAGLEAGAAFHDEWQDGDGATRLREQAHSLREAIERAVARSAPRRGNRPAYPASPYRRMDSGAIGSVACSYPLGLVSPDEPRLKDTLEFLLQECFIDGAFFQNMIHSGWNAYLTLHVAQALLRAGDRRFIRIVERVAELASPTGQWPEAINPRTGGGCMGDGQHVWAAADWVMMLRNMFVREEGTRLVIASGIAEQWLANGEALAFGPAPTAHGTVDILIEPRGDSARVLVQGDWHDSESPPEIEIRLPGAQAVCLPKGESEAVISMPRGGGEALHMQGTGGLHR